VAGICYAVIPIVESGILTGKKATVYPTNEAKNILKKYNVIFVSDGCVTLEQEKIITAQGPAFTKDFGNAITTMLE
jgi:protease I